MVTGVLNMGDVALEVVFVVVDANSELLCNGLAVDCVDQRVHFIGNKFDRIDVTGVRITC